MAKNEKKENNIAFVGDGKPLREVNTASEKIALPEDQSKPFYHERARFMCQTFPHLYKPVKEKG